MVWRNPYLVLSGLTSHSAASPALPSCCREALPIWRRCSQLCSPPPPHLVMVRPAVWPSPAGDGTASCVTLPNRWWGGQLCRTSAGGAREPDGPYPWKCPSRRLSQPQVPLTYCMYRSLQPNVCITTGNLMYVPSLQPTVCTPDYNPLYVQWLHPSLSVVNYNLLYVCSLTTTFCMYLWL